MPDQLDAKQRLLQAITYLAATRSYAESTLGELLRHAGVARATFYKYFADKHACLLAAERYHGERLLKALEQDPADPWSALARFTRSNPHALTILAEIQIADEQQLRQHDITREQLASAMTREDADKLTGTMKDPPPAVLAGAAIRALAMETHQSKPNPDALTKHIGSWFQNYVADNPRPQWRQLGDRTALEDLQADWPSSSRGLEILSESKPPTSHSQETQRQSILHAIVDVTHKYGYVRSTVSEIAMAAGVSRGTFYAHFPDKATAFQTAHQTIFGDLMALCMRNFVKADEWPDKVWNGGHMFASFFAKHPMLAKFVFVDSLTSGTVKAKHQLYGYLEAFAVFLEPSGDAVPARPTSHTSAQLIANAIFELNYEYVRAGRSRQLTSLLPFATYLILAPSIGTSEADQFIEQKLSTLGALTH